MDSCTHPMAQLCQMGQNLNAYFSPDNPKIGRKRKKNGERERETDSQKRTL